LPSYISFFILFFSVMIKKREGWVKTTSFAACSHQI